MSAPINDGGPAFPAPAYAANITDKGMSLRDYFAGQALAGALADPTCDLYPSELAKIAYTEADAMLAARKEVQP
jgi:hypothetical protein